MGDDTQRKAALGILGLLTDDQLAQQIADIDALHDMTVNKIDAWIRAQANRPLAVSLAWAVEKGRDTPRESLAKKLAAIK